MYHITKIKYLDKILTEGLKTHSLKKGIACYAKDSYYEKYGCSPVFLTDNYQVICDTMLTKDWVKDACLLEVDINGLKVEKGFYDNEFIVKRNIPACRIKLLKQIKLYVNV